MLHAVSRHRSNAAVMSLNALIAQPSDAGLHPNPVYRMCIFPEYEHSREKKQNTRAAGFVSKSSLQQSALPPLVKRCEIREQSYGNT